MNLQGHKTTGDGTTYKRPAVKAPPQFRIKLFQDQSYIPGSNYTDPRRPADQGWTRENKAPTLTGHTRLWIDEGKVRNHLDKPANLSNVRRVIIVQRRA